MQPSRYAPPKADLGSDGATGCRSWNALETPATVWVKRIAAVGLAAGFFLPLTSCSGRDYSAATAYDWPSFGFCVAILAGTFVGITWLVYWGGHMRYGALAAYGTCASYAAGLAVLIKRRVLA